MSIAENCGICQQPICICEDFEKRLDETQVAYKACVHCGKHYDRCKCEKPEYSVRLNGEWEELFALQQGLVCICDTDSEHCPRHTRFPPGYGKKKEHE